jgi:hypothetical protein
MFLFFGAKNPYGGAIGACTQFPPAFTPRERAKVEAFFGRKRKKRQAEQASAERDRSIRSRPS